MVVRIILRKQLQNTGTIHHPTKQLNLNVPKKHIGPSILALLAYKYETKHFKVKISIIFYFDPPNTPLTLIFQFSGIK
jgi:hypothetical protein